MRRTKVCSKCTTDKHVSRFYADKRHKGGLSSECKLCRQVKIKEYNTRNKENIEKKQKRYAKTEQRKAVVRRYQLSGKGKVVYKKAAKRYYQSELGKAAISRALSTRRTRNQSVVNDLTLVQWQEILVLQRKSCAVCNTSFSTRPATRDHIVPVSRGGGLTKNNVQALCQPCNSSKGTKTMREYTRAEV